MRAERFRAQGSIWLRLVPNLWLSVVELPARRVIRPALKGSGVEWHGWHAFRRGLATNLYRLGVPDKTIQAILRHSNLSTTMNTYVKSVSADATAAMRALEELCKQHATTVPSREAAVM